MRQSLRACDLWLVATACLLHASKVEEAHLKVRDVLATASRVRWGRSRPAPAPGTSAFNAARDELTDCERRLLHTLQFSVAVELPFRSISATVRSWRDSGALGRREEAAPAAYAIDARACRVAGALAVGAAGLLFPPAVLAGQALQIVLRRMSTAGALPPGVRAEELGGVWLAGPPAAPSAAGALGAVLVQPPSRLEGCTLLRMWNQFLADGGSCHQAAVAALSAHNARRAPQAARAGGAQATGAPHQGGMAGLSAPYTYALPGAGREAPGHPRARQLPTALRADLAGDALALLSADKLPCSGGDAALPQRLDIDALLAGLSQNKQ